MIRDKTVILSCPGHVYPIGDMSYTSKQLGATGEDLAAAFLTRHGYRVIARNVRARWGEIDIVARQKERLHFVEVKTRRSLKHGQPYEAVQTWKVQHLKKAAYVFMIREGLPLSTPLSMDVISILHTEGALPQIKMYENIEVRS